MFALVIVDVQRPRRLHSTKLFILNSTIPAAVCVIDIHDDDDDVSKIRMFLFS